MISFKKLKNTSLRSLDDFSFLGIIKDLIIDPENGQLLALTIKKKFWEPKKILSFLDIIKITPNITIVNSKDAILSKEEIIRVKEILDSNFRVLNNKVETEQGSFVGWVKDIFIDPQLFVLKKIEVKNLIGESILVPKEKIVSMSPKMIIIEDLGVKKKILKQPSVALETEI